jgi:hypothetical protein
MENRVDLNTFKSAAYPDGSNSAVGIDILDIPDSDRLLRHWQGEKHMAAYALAASRGSPRHLKPVQFGADLRASNRRTLEATRRCLAKRGWSWSETLGRQKDTTREGRVFRPETDFVADEG